MSITFGFAGDDQVTTSYSCCDPDDSGRPTGCPECQGTGKVYFTDDANAVQASNSNALYIMELLGIEPDYVGSIAPSELKQRSEAALLLESGDYERRKLSGLRALAIIAAERGADRISWG